MTQNNTATNPFKKITTKNKLTNHVTKLSCLSSQSHTAQLSLNKRSEIVRKFITEQANVLFIYVSHISVHYVYM